MKIQENVSLKGKTTMRIGGSAKYYAELSSKEDVERAVEFAQQKNVPLIPLGGGSNTIFANGEINALVVRITASDVRITNHESLTVEAGKNLPMLINELAKQGLDLSPLTGILGTVGGAVFGNAGQGPNGIWIDSYIESVEVFTDSEWKVYNNDECDFSYRESVFKNLQKAPPIIWSVTLAIPKRDPTEIEAEIKRLLQQRIETQPHVKTAGSCFKAAGGTPAWQLIDNAGLRETAHGGVHISEKHANFLINDGEGTFDDAVQVVKTIEDGIPEGLEVEMRFIKEDGTLQF
ncbi:MAG: FAD-binding protein [Candidatus Peregrinibacteria bacterium]|nr:FAD-binding protein [Candidatus Peregrinibacteria bacterium]MCB9807937.1 FAD-binding protein [Candidatus Peribacteria bacterium]